jgi:IS30 family transposase
VYYADTAQVKYERAREHSVCLSFDEKYSSQFFIELEIALKSKPREHSVDSFVHYYKQEHPEEHVPSTSVVYRLIDEGELEVKSIHLPKKPSRRPRKANGTKAKGSNKKVLGTSIEERPEAVETREEFGHYEAALVIGKQGADEPVVLTVVERKSRQAFVRKIGNKTAEAVKEALSGLITEVGVEHFKSITFDNGSEFSTMPELVGVDVYFAHAYSSFERGSNENFNGLLREYMPKKTSFHEFSDTDIQVYQDCINNRLRKILGYKSAAQVYAEALAS